MRQDKGIYYQITTVAIIAGSIALIGIVVGLYFEFLPERSLLIRYTEIGFFLFCLPVLLREAWLRLNVTKYPIKLLKISLVAISTLLVLFLYLAFVEGGIITSEFLVVVILMIMIVILTSIGADNIKRALNRINTIPLKTTYPSH